MKKTICLLFSLLFALLALGGCAVREEAERLYTVVLTRCEHVTCEHPVLAVPRGADACFFVEIEEGYLFDGADAPEYTFEEGELTVKNVRRSLTVELSVKEKPIEGEPIVPPAPETFAVSLKGEIEGAEERTADGGDLTFSFRAEGRVTSVGYAGEYCLFETLGSPNEYRLTLKKVERGGEIGIGVADGGEIALSGGQRAVRYQYDENNAMTDVFLLDTPRVNTDVSPFEREGYTMAGWNTRPDGKGEHIGIGSRVRVDRSETLFAEWREWSSEEKFSFAVVNRESIPSLYDGSRRTLEELAEEEPKGERVAIVTGYSGGERELVLPSSLGGYRVAGIGERAVTQDSALVSAVLPRGLDYVADNAFGSLPYLSSVTLFDDVVHLGTAAFGFRPAIRTLHINAALPPVYGNIENGQFGNKMELLYQSIGRKIVVFGGCSAWYGIDSKMIGEAFEGYEVYNMGVIGGTSALFQVDLIKECLNKGDLFLHLPELISQFQLFAVTEFDLRVFMTIECNYDLVARLDMQKYSHVFESLADFLTGKRVRMEAEDYVPLTYRDGLGYMDGHGDLTNSRAGWYDNEGVPFRFIHTFELNGYHATDNMKEIYGSIAALGVPVYLGFGPVNNDGINRLDGDATVGLITASLAGSAATVIMDLDDCLMDKRYFYDTNYHLSNEGANVFTQRVIEKWKSVL